MPARNAAKTIKESIESVLQDSLVSQLVIVDDGSTDKTTEIIQSIPDHRITLVPGPQQGIGAAFNCGLEKATGAFIGRCDADDLYPSERLAWQREYLLTHPGSVAVSGGFRTIMLSGKSVAELATEGESRSVRSLLLQGKAVTHFCTWLTRTEAINHVGGARKWFETAEDIDLQFRLAMQGEVCHIPKICYIYRLHNQSITHTQSTSRLKFYETHATLFAQQRLTDGQDALELGTPPLLPSPTAQGEGGGCANNQISGQLVGQSWKLFRDGNHKEAIRTLCFAIKEQPLRADNWIQLAIMIIKTAGCSTKTKANGQGT